MSERRGKIKNKKSDKKRKKSSERRRFSITITSADAVKIRSECINLNVPTLLELKQLLLSKKDGLSKYFQKVLIDIIEPNKINLTKMFGISSKNIGGSEILINIGSLNYLNESNNINDIPSYSLTDIIGLINKKHLNKNDDLYIFGNGLGSTNVVKNSNIIIDWNTHINHKNIKSIEYKKKIIQSNNINNNDEKKQDNNDSNNNDIINESKGNNNNNDDDLKDNIVKDIFKIQHYPSNEIGCQGNVFLSQGKDTRLLLIECQTRIADDNFCCAIQKVLQKYINKSRETNNNNNNNKSNTIIALGGLIQVLNGDINGYLISNNNEHKKVNANGSNIIMYSTIISNDVKNFKLNTNNCQFINQKKNQAGNYVNDTTPKTIKYRGYFNIAKYLYVVGNPNQSQ